MRFTDKYIKSIKAQDKPFVVTAESDSRGVGRLQLKIYPSGNKKFQFQFFYEGKRKRMEIGSYGAWSLADAKKESTHLSDLLQRGKNPVATRELIKTAKIASESQRTLIQMIADFYEFINERWAPNTVKRTVNAFKSNLIPFISTKMMPDELTSDFARELIYKIYNRDAKQQAAIFKSDLMALYKFAINFDNSPAQFKMPDIYSVKVNPIHVIHFEIPKSVGTRWLSEEEIYKLWNAKDLPIKTQQYYKLALALAGQRVAEVYHGKSNEFDFKESLFTIPVERIKIKGRGDHIIPISLIAETIVKSLLITRGKDGHLWPHRDKANEPAHVSTIRMATQRWCNKNNIPMFSPRDIRRTCKTLMGKAGISKKNRDIMQQHSKIDMSTIHYDRYDYINEKRESMTAWTEFLQMTITTKPKQEKQI
jgi:integrase